MDRGLEVSVAVCMLVCVCVCVSRTRELGDTARGVCSSVHARVCVCVSRTRELGDTEYSTQTRIIALGASD